MADQPPAVPDDDTLAAALALWESDKANLPKLFKTPPRAGRLRQLLQAVAGGAPKPLEMPYAAIECVKAREPQRMTGGVHYDYRKLTVKVWGVRADVVKAMGFVTAVFNINSVLAYPSTDPESKLPRFIRFWPDPPGGRIEQDKDTARGQDVWAGIVEGEVWSVRRG